MPSTTQDDLIRSVPASGPASAPGVEAPLPSGNCAPPLLDDMLDGLARCLRESEPGRERAATAAAALLADPGLVGRSMRRATRVLAANDLVRDTGRELLRVAFLAAARTLADGTGAPAAGAESLDELQRRAESEPRPEPERVLEAGLDLFEAGDTPRTILDALAYRYSNAARTASAVAADRGLADLVLQLVNSPFYGVERRIDTLDRAVAFLGANELSALAVAVGALRRFGRDGALPPDWRLRAVTAGAVAKLLARRTGTPGEWFFVAELLRDAAGLVLARVAPARSALVWRLAVEEARPLGAVRPEWFGFDPDELTVRLLETWGLPAGLIELVRHAGGSERDARTRTEAVLHVAGVVAAAAASGALGGPSAPRLDAGAWTGLGLSSGVLGRVAQEAEGQVGGMLRTLESL